MQVAAYGERTTERMSVATWTVCGLVITERTAKFPFGIKVEQITVRLLTGFL